MREYCRANNTMSSLFYGNNFEFAPTSIHQAFFKKDKKAYTEDNILIYNTFVYNIPQWFTQTDIWIHFAKFGGVSDVEIVDDRSCRATSKAGIVNFVEPEGAYRALLKRIHRIQGSRVKVKAGDSWNQPNAEKACNEKKLGTEAVCNTKQRENEALNVNAKWAGLNILSLNDDCLEIICDQLGLRDQIRFARVCPRFREIFEMLSRRKYKRLDFDEIKWMTLWQIRDFFRFAGKNIEEVSGNVPYRNRERIITFITTFCVNLKRLSLNRTKILLDCQRILQPLQYLNQLECLSLTKNYELTGKFISALVQLKVLNLYGCSKIQPSHLVEICRAMQNLKSLDIRRCEQLRAIFLNSLVEDCKQLEILKISCPDIPYERVSLPPRLKHIELLLDTNFSVSHTPIFFELAENKSQQIETLKIYGKNSINNQQISLISKLQKLKSFSCPNNQAIDDDALREFCKLEQLEELGIRGCKSVTNGALLKLLRSCKHLRHLNIEKCRKITHELVLEAINVLKDRKDRSQTPLVLFVEGTSIDKSGLSECQKYKAAEKESLIKVVFKTLTVDKGLHVNQTSALWDSECWFSKDDGTFFPDWDMDEYDDFDDVVVV